jgi:hypothetical protein
MNCTSRSAVWFLSIETDLRVLDWHKEIAFFLSLRIHYYYYYYYYYYYFLGSTAQLRPWPPQNPAEFLGGFSTIFFLQGRVVSPTPNPHPGGPGLCILYSPEAGWLPILVASYDTHGLRWDYSYSPVITRGTLFLIEKKIIRQTEKQRRRSFGSSVSIFNIYMNFFHHTILKCLRKSTAQFRCVSRL